MPGLRLTLPCPQAFSWVEMDAILTWQAQAGSITIVHSSYSM